MTYLALLVEYKEGLRCTLNLIFTWMARYALTEIMVGRRQGWRLKETH